MTSFIHSVGTSCWYIKLDSVDGILHSAFYVICEFPKFVGK